MHDSYLYRRVVEELYVDAPEAAAQPANIRTDVHDDAGEDAVADERHRHSIAGVHPISQPVDEREIATPHLDRVARRGLLFGAPLVAHRSADVREVRMLERFGGGRHGAAEASEAARPQPRGSGSSSAPRPCRSEESLRHRTA